MNFYSDETYGESVAGVYDEWYSEYDPRVIDVLAELAHGGRALELLSSQAEQVRCFQNVAAHLACLRLRERWSNWQREPFSSESKKHISVFGF